MERLRQRDLRALSSFLHQIYATLDLEGFGFRIVETLPKIVPSEWTSYNEVNPQSQTISYTMDPVPSDFPDAEQVLAQHIPEHPLINHYRQTHGGQALKISDFLTQRQFHQLGLYSEFYRRLEVERQMAVVLPAPPPLMIGIAVNRNGKDFSERERLLFDLLRPHLMQAYRNAESTRRLRLDVELMERALGGLNRGAVFLAEEGRIESCTGQARRLLWEYFERSSQEDHLPESLQHWVKHQRSLLSRDDAPPPRKPLILERPGKRLAVRLVDRNSEDRYLLLLEERHVPFSLGSIETLGLTRREAEILLRVAQGKTNAEIATELYVSRLTVKKHLEHIYRKLGVESRTQATALALEVLDIPLG